MTRTEIILISVGVLVLINILINLISRRMVLFKLRNKEPTEQVLDLQNQITLFQHIDLVAVLADIDGKIIYVNDIVEKILFWTPAELIGKNILIFIPERFHEAHQKGMRRFQATHQGEILNQTINLFSLTKGGGEIPIELTVEKKEENNKTYIIGLIRDMSKYTAKISGLQKLIDFYKHSETLIGMGCFNCDVINGTVFMSDNMLSIFDLSPEHNNCSIQVTSDRIISTDQARVAEVVAQAVEEKKNYEVDFTLRNNKHLRVVAGMEFDSFGDVTNIQGALRILPV